ncbi:MAG: TonB-dependent receptor [Pseudomonadales bacterium]|nr:TonB-dependent receptor [Pseudomonadales bacterium]
MKLLIGGMVRVLRFVPFVFSFAAFNAVAGEETREIEEVVVTGSYLKRSTADSPSPLSVVDQADIASIGATEITDVVASMTYNSGSIRGAVAGLGGDSGIGNTNINLRNLGNGSTLVLINGHRNVAAEFDNSGNAYVDLGSIVPMIALKRVEIVKDGSSALYGSDAIAGVVNFITQNDFEGFSFDVTRATDDETGNQDDTTIQAMMGVASDRGSITVAVSWFDREELTVGDRFDYFGGAGVTSFGKPGNFDALGAIAADPNSPNPSDSFGNRADLDCNLVRDIDGRGALGQIGSSCFYDFSTFFPLSGEQTQTKIFTSARYQLSDNIEIYGDAGASENQFIRNNSLFPDVTFAVIPVGNLGLINDASRRGILPVPLLASQRLLGGHIGQAETAARPVDTHSNYNRDFFRVSGGVRTDFEIGNREWNVDLAFTRSERKYAQNIRSDTLTNNTNAAYQGLGGPLCNPASDTAGSGNLGTGDCFYFNPFASSRFKPDGSPQDDPLLLNPDDLLNWMAGEIITLTENTQTVVDLVAAGELWQTEKGPIQMAIGAQWRRDEIEHDPDKNQNNNNFKFSFGEQDYEAEEKTFAVFMETSIPLTENLELDIAIRYEDFEELDDDTVDPKATLLWRPVDSLSLRASVGTSFRTPSLLQSSGQTTSLLNSSDPFGSTGGLAFRPTLTDGNPNLKPEEATAYNIGFSWAPVDGILEGLSVDMDYYNYDYDDIITREAHQDLINKDNAARCPQGVSDFGDSTGSDAFNPDIPLCGVQSVSGITPDGTVVTKGQIISVGPGTPDKVIRNAAGDLLRTQASFLNAQSLETDGIDLSISYKFELDNWGRFGVGLTGSYTLSYDLVNADGVSIDGVGKRNESNSVGRPLPEYQAVVNLTWARNRHDVQAFVRYLDGYEDDTVGASAFRAGLIGIDPNETINSFTTVDFQYNYQVPGFSVLDEGGVITLGMKNAFDRLPPHMNTSNQFDARTHDPRGRILYARYKIDM